jgi:hypothetical protein
VITILIGRLGGDLRHIDTLTNESVAHLFRSNSHSNKLFTYFTCLQQLQNHIYCPEDSWNTETLTIKTYRTQQFTKENHKNREHGASIEIQACSRVRSGLCL